MRYIITHRPAEIKGMPIVITSHAAIVAASGQEALAEFARLNPDRVAIRVESIPENSPALPLYGLGAKTVTEIQDQLDAAKERNEGLHREHEEARAYVGTYSLDELGAEQEYRARRDSEEAQNEDGAHVGDIFCACWGYDQTNYDFYQIVELRGKHTALIRKNAVRSFLCGDWSGYTRPIRDSFAGEETITMRTSWNDYTSKPRMRIPRLSGTNYMEPIEFGKMYEFTTGA